MKRLFVLFFLGVFAGCNPIGQKKVDTSFLRDPPTAFGFIYALSLDGAAFVQWSDSVGTVSYELYRSQSGGERSKIYSGVDTYYEDSSLENGVTYTYSAVAIGYSENTSSSDSPDDLEGDAFFEQAEITPSDVPGAFSIVSAVASSNQIVLTWEDSVNAITYYVFRGTESEVYTEEFAEVSSPLTDTDVVNGITYFYVVVAVGYSDIQVSNNELSATPN